MMPLFFHLLLHFYLLFISLLSSFVVLQIRTIISEIFSASKVIFALSVFPSFLPSLLAHFLALFFPIFFPVLLLSILFFLPLILPLFLPLLLPLFLISFSFLGITFLLYRFLLWIWVP